MLALAASGERFHGLDGLMDVGARPITVGFDPLAIGNRCRRARGALSRRFGEGEVREDRSRAGDTIDLGARQPSGAGLTRRDHKLGGAEQADRVGSAGVLGAPQQDLRQQAVSEQVAERYKLRSGGGILPVADAARFDHFVDFLEGQLAGRAGRYHKEVADGHHGGHDRVRGARFVGRILQKGLEGLACRGAVWCPADLVHQGGLAVGIDFGGGSSSRLVGRPLLRSRDDEAQDLVRHSVMVSVGCGRYRCDVWDRNPECYTTKACGPLLVSFPPKCSDARGLLPRARAKGQAEGVLGLDGRTAGRAFASPRVQGRTRARPERFRTEQR
ncbi:MAG: hypothetical protein HYX76_07795 [Acidobacteria bacterium]|nr:hypothetical protein [Acidobacteriota bacterium]